MARPMAFLIRIDLTSLAQQLADNQGAFAELHHVESFQDVVTAVIGAEGAGRQHHPLDVAHRLDVEWSLRSFLSRVDFPARAPTIDDAGAAQLAERYRAAAAPTDAEVTSLVVIDGLAGYSPASQLS
jgi:hypothetical protein